MASREDPEPALNVPAAVLLPILALLGVHVARNALAPEASLALVWSLAFSPARLLGEAQFRDLDVADLAPAALGLIAYPLVSASLPALVLDALFLAIFGTVVARRFGARRFAILGILGALSGALAYLILLPQEATPLIGAGALVGAYSGAAARFAFPEGPAAVRADGDAVSHVRAQTLKETFSSPSALSFVALYLGPKLAFLGLGGALGAALAGEVLVPAVAFAAGLCLFGWLDPVRAATSAVPAAREDPGKS